MGQASALLTDALANRSVQRSARILFEIPPTEETMKGRSEAMENIAGKTFDCLRHWWRHHACRLFALACVPLT